MIYSLIPRMFHILTMSNPFKIFNAIISTIGIFVIYLWKIIGIWDKGLGY